MVPQFLWTAPLTLRTRLAVLVTLVIALLCLMPGDEVPKVNLPFLDKGVHLAMFLGFGLMWRWRFIHGSKIAGGIILAGLVYSVVLELLQSHVASARSFELADIFANLIGTGAGIGICQAVMSKAAAAKAKASERV